MITPKEKKVSDNQTGQWLQGRGHEKCLDTEDKVLVKLRQLGMQIIPRARFPEEWRLRSLEVDAIAVSDSGIFLIEVTREAGVLMSQEHTDQVTVTKRGHHQMRRDWSLDIGKMSEELQAILERVFRTEKSLKSLRSKWRTSFGRVPPVTPVLIFGPSTSFQKYWPRHPNVVVASTRTYGRVLKALISKSPKVPMTGKILANYLSRNLYSQGILRIAGNEGFLRCIVRQEQHIKGIDRLGLLSIQSGKNGVIVVDYFDGKSLKLKDEVVFEDRKGARVCLNASQQEFSFYAGPKSWGGRPMDRRKR